MSPTRNSTLSIYITIFDCFYKHLGITNGFVQESGTVSPSYIPVFDGTGIVESSENHSS